MTFSKQDAITFLIGLGAAILITVAEALIDAEAIRDIGWETWGTNLAIGLASAAGRYLVTYLAQEGFAGGE